MTIYDNRKLRAGEWVEVRTRQEILQTLDENGQLDGLPFMPEMLEYCGKRLRVYKRAHKTCDPPSGPGGRRMRNAVLLEGARCDGRGHGGCEARCLIFWKQAWLRRADAPSDLRQEVAAADHEACTEDELLAGAYGDEGPESENPTYVCQATHMAAATEPLQWWDIRQYVEDYTSGNAGFWRIVSAFVFSVYHHITGLGFGFGSALRWSYDTFQKLRGGVPYPWHKGRVPKGARTPTVRLDLQAGDPVRTKEYREILETLDQGWKNRGMGFDAEMVPYCDDTFRVLSRVERLIDEKSGKMLHLKNPAIILDGVVCEARYSECRLFCPRSFYPYWREIWLDRVDDGDASVPERATAT